MNNWKLDVLDAEQQLESHLAMNMKMIRKHMEKVNGENIFGIDKKYIEDEIEDLYREEENRRRVDAA